MSGLEQRYRRLLRLLPAAYRARWEEEMVDTFLLTALPTDLDAEQAQFAADYGRPSVPESWSVLMLAVRLRLGAGESAGRSVTYGGALRLVGLVGLLLLAAPTGLDAVTLILAKHHQGQPEYPQPQAWWWVGALAGVLRVGAYLALVTGSRRACRVLTVLALVLSVVLVGHYGLSSRDQWLYLVYNAAYVVLPGMLPLIALVAFHPAAPAVRSRPWLIALPVAMVSAAALAWLGAVLPAFLFDLPGIDDALLLVTTAGYLVARRTRQVGRTAQWPLALAVLSAVALAARGITLAAYGPLLPGYPLYPLYVMGIVEAALLLAALVVLVPLARRDLTALPAAAP